MNQHEFDILLQKYLSGSCDAEEKKFMETWYQNQSFEISDFNEEGIVDLKLKMWEIINKKTTAKKGPQLNFWVKRGIAASIIFAFLSIVFLKYSTSNQLSYITKLDGVEITNNSLETKIINLEDGSIVELASKSSLSYSVNFGQINREVTLTGEGFFKIKRNPQKPFIVHAGDLVTQVLGTSFRIKPVQGNNSNIEVSVLTGRVSIYENNNFEKNKKNGIVLTPNQKVVFNNITKEMLPSIVEQPIVLNLESMSKQLVFEEVNILSIVKTLNEMYGIEIILVNDEIGNCSFTGDISGMSLLTQIEVISKTIGANYEERGTEIFIYGKGCK